MCSKANRKLGYVKRVLGTACSFETKFMCYTTMVRPIMEYGLIIWSSGYKQQLIMVESVQRRSIQLIEL